MPRPGPLTIPTLSREHPTRRQEIVAAAEKSGDSLSGWLRRAHAYALLNMPADWEDPNPPSGPPPEAVSKN